MMRRQPFTSRPQPPLRNTIGLNIAGAMFNPVALVRGSCVPGQLLKPIYGCDVTGYQSQCSRISVQKTVLFLFSYTYTFSDTTELLRVSNLSIQDAFYSHKLMFELNVLPLAWQITTICGNVLVSYYSSARKLIMFMTILTVSLRVYRIYSYLRELSAQ